MTVASRIACGELNITGEINERLPVITNGLIAHFPMDGRGGVFDFVGGNNPTTAVCPNFNMIEAHYLDWRDPNNWTRIGGSGSLSWDDSQQALCANGYWYGYFNGFIQIDTSKHWYCEVSMKKEGPNGTCYVGDVSYQSDKVTLTPQHPGSYEYFCICGTVPSSEWTTYNNYYIGGVARTGTGTSVGVQNVFDPNCCYIRPMFFANYSNGVVNTDKVYIRRFKWYYSDADNSNCTITSDGIAIEEATTNIVPGDATNPDSGWGSHNHTTISYNNLIAMGFPVIGDINIKGYKQDKTCGAATWSGNSYSYTNIGNPSVVSGDVYTASVWCYVSIDCNVDWARISVEGATNSATSYYSLSKKGAWQKLLINITCNATGTAPVYLYFCKSGITDFSTMTGYIIYAAPQYEKKSFATSFINGARSSSGLLNIPINTTSSDFTIFYNYIPDKNWATNYVSSAFNKYNWYLYDKNTGKKVWLSDYTYRSAASDPWIGFDEFVYSHWHAENIITPNNEYWFALTKTGITWTRYFLTDSGTMVSTMERSETELMNFIPKELDFVADYNWRIRNLSIYNRALSYNEILKIGKGISFSIDSSGNMKSPKIIEKPNGIPNDAYYFPLSCDSKDETKIYGATENINTVFEDGSVWVGTSSTNLLTNQQSAYLDGTTSGWSVSYGPSIVEGVGPSGNKYARTIVASGGVDQYSHTVSTAITASTAYTYSIKIKTADLSAGNYVRMATYWANSGTFVWENMVWAYSLNADKKWITISATSTSPATANEARLIFAALNKDGIGSYCACDAKIELGPFRKPYNLGTRNASSLEYNLNSTIGLDWSKDWSIIYFKKPVGTYDDTLIGYNIESLGCNSNNIGGGYTWWGKVMGSNTIYSSTPSAMDPAKYFGNWRMVSKTKTGTTITTKEWSPLEGVYVRTDSTTNTVANYYVTQYGYDFKLGGWDNTNPCNSYYRDLIIVKGRAMSDTELNDIYRTLIRNKSDGSTIQYKLNEGMVL